MPTKPATKRASGTPTAADTVWSDEERAAVQAAAAERKAQAGRGAGSEREAGEAEWRACVTKMPPDDRAMAERIHAIVLAAVPALVPKTYYGMPGYSTQGKTGKSICFFKPKSKFRVRYSTVGFQPAATLDDGDMWPTEFAVISLTPAVEARLVELVRKAVG